MVCGKVACDSFNTMAGLLEGTGHCQLLSGRQVKRIVSEKGRRKYTGETPEHSVWPLSEVTPQSYVLRSIGLGRPGCAACQRTQSLEDTLHSTNSLEQPVGHNPFTGVTTIGQHRYLHYNP